MDDDDFMLVDSFLMFATKFCCCSHLSDNNTGCNCSKTEDVGDENRQNRQQHVKAVEITFRLHNPLPTSIRQELRQ